MLVVRRLHSPNLSMILNVVRSSSLIFGILGLVTTLACGSMRQEGSLESATPADAEKIYSVREVAGLIDTNPESLRDKTIILKAYYGDSVPGEGCTDYLIFIDREDSELYARRYAKDVTSAERESIKTIPMVISGPSLSFPRSIFPTAFALFQGHFFDPRLSSCPGGWTYFVIEAKVSELTDDVPLASKRAVVDRGFVIARGKLLSRPYEITLQEHSLRINGVLYRPVQESQIERTTIFTDKGLLFNFDSLTGTLGRGYLVMYGGNGYQRSIPASDASMIVNGIQKIMSANEAERVRRRKLARLLETDASATEVNEIIQNWRN
jgi:hypothetical protein